MPPWAKQWPPPSASAPAQRPRLGAGWQTCGDTTGRALIDRYRRRRAERDPTSDLSGTLTRTANEWTMSNVGGADASSGQARLLSAADYEFGQAVQVRKSQGKRGLLRGQVGAIVGRFGEPPTHYLVSVPAASNYGVFAAGHLRPAKARASALAPAPLGPWLRPNPCDYAFLRQVPCLLATAECAMTSPDLDFQARYGLLFDMQLQPSSPYGNDTGFVACVYFARGEHGLIAPVPQLPVFRLTPPATSHADESESALLDVSETARARPSWQELPDEMQQQVLSWASNEELNLWARLDQKSRGVARYEAMRPRRQQILLQTLCDAPSQWKATLVKQRLVAMQLGQPIAIPTLATRDDMLFCARLLEGAPHKPRARFFTLGCELRMARLPSALDLEWSYSQPTLLASKDVRAIAPNLRLLSLRLTAASADGVCALADRLPPHATVELQVDEWKRGARRPPICRQMLITSLDVPLSAVTSGDLLPWLRSPHLHRLTLRDGDSAAPDFLARSRHKTIEPRPVLPLPARLRALTCNGDVLRLFPSLGAQYQLRNVVLWGTEWGTALGAVRMLPFVEVLRLTEEGDAKGEVGSSPSQVTLGAALAQGRLGWSIRSLRVCAPSLAAHLHAIFWPRGLLALDLSGSPLGRAARGLQLDGDALEVLNLTGTSCAEATLQMVWPASLKKVRLDADDISPSARATLRQRSPAV